MEHRIKAGCNLDAILDESLMHLTTSKLDQNIIHKLDQRIDQNGWTDQCFIFKVW